ncbi:hypothetical protein NDU88_005612 [Pleurodeles waltl]|uniref:ribonuclease H n=1 Tax=Pleurodeles waltl TaxID=8319 RepID=A0AAV7QIC6_PLEWA|nr:hypothetical protein NDU88_005612 [Pleurodeles waltl]
MGLWRYTCLNFGISSAKEIFQPTIKGVLEGLAGVLNIGDDILLHAPTLESHLACLRAVFPRLREHGLTLHREKCKFLKEDISFFRYRFSKQGIGPDPAKQGVKNPADFLSRHAHLAMPQEAKEALEIEEYVKLVVDRARPLPIPFADVVEATSQDDCLLLAMEAVCSNDWRPLQHSASFHTAEARATLQDLFHVRHELPVSYDECLLRGSRLVLPACLGHRAVLLAHSTHQGIAK